MAHTLYNNEFKNAVPAALCIELFHNFSLIHDDIMDNAPLRRGKSTVHKKWNNTIAILSGDAMLVKAFSLLSENYDEKILKSLATLFNFTAAQVCEGQQLDMDFEQRKNVSFNEYIKMIALKTSVLLGCALKMGAIVANANDEEQNHLYEFGKNIGIAFQLHDDFLDSYGNPSKTGKQPGGDILAGKKTALVIECIEKSNEKDVNDLNELLHGNSPNKVNEVIRLFDKYNIQTETRSHIEHYRNKAVFHLQQLQVSMDKKLPLLKLSEFLLNREH